MDFFKEILPSKISEKQIKHFFKLYCKRSGKDEPGSRVISIKALSFNYEKYKKTETEVANIMSDKAAKERYVAIKEYMV